MTSSTVKLSIIILTQKKDANLQRALRSAQFAKEVIVIENNRVEDFSLVRNQALNEARQKWVFFLDSDEEISSQSIPEIKKIISKNLADGVIVHRQDIFYDQAIKYGEASNAQLVRMAKRNRISWKRPVHEVAMIDGDIINSKIFLTHQAHASIKDFISSIIRYAQIEANYQTGLNQNPSLIKLIMFPMMKFLYNYILKRGILDGWRGLSYALIMSLHSFSVRVFQYEFQNQKKDAKNI